MFCTKRINVRSQGKTTMECLVWFAQNSASTVFTSCCIWGSVGYGKSIVLYTFLSLVDESYTFFFLYTHSSRVGVWIGYLHTLVDTEILRLKQHSLSTCKKYNLFKKHSCPLPREPCDNMSSFHLNVHDYSYFRAQRIAIVVLTSSSVARVVGGYPQDIRIVGYPSDIHYNLLVSIDMLP